MGNGGMMGAWNSTTPQDISSEMTVTPEQAIEFAQTYLDANISGATAADDPIQFYGYYTLDFEKDGKVVVYSTDGEHKLQSETETAAIIDFYRDADLVIFDAMYSLSDMITIREDWGHSSNVVGVDLCVRARVKHYCMFHHEPAYSDETIHAILRETKRYEEIVREREALQDSTAYDGLVLEV